MRPLQPAELTRMRHTNEGAMFDTCVVLRHSAAASDVLGLPGATYTEAEPQACGYKPSTTKEANDNGQVVIVDALLRMAHDAEIGPLDRVRITHRFGEALDPQPLYSVIGQPAMGPSGFVVNLALVTDEV